MALKVLETKHCKCHEHEETVRSLLYCLLFADDYVLDVKKDSCKNLLMKIRNRYFVDAAASDDTDMKNLPDDYVEMHDGLLSFTCKEIRHDVMYAFITECLVEDSDLEFFLTTASRCVISEYCRSWKYKKREDERCLYIPNRPQKMYDLFIDKMEMDIIKHCTVSDRSIHSRIKERLSVPEEIFKWDLEARKRYAEYAGRGTQTVHQARGMIVGCAGAGKTTLLRRLLRWSEEKILNVTPTEGVDVHEEIFEIGEEGKLLKAQSLDGTQVNEENLEGYVRKTLTFFDFGGQCAYYACHQIYLTRRAFYIVVVDASKCLDDVVDENVCDQKNSVFFGWTYGEYFVFWIKSIHTYCGTESEQDHQPVVIIVATHWENDQRLYKNKEEFIEKLQGKIPRNANLLQYIREDRCFLIHFPVEPLDNLEEYIRNIVRNKRWEEKIPKEWAYFELEINQKKGNEKILNELDTATSMSKNEEGSSGDTIQEQREKKDMLRFYHDTGKILYFNEEGLDKLVIIDVQWFIDAFKKIITDKLHMKGIPCSKENLEDYYETGNLKDQVLTDIWKQMKILREQRINDKSKDTKDDAMDGNETEVPDNAYFKPGISNHREHPKRDPVNDPRDFLLYKPSILTFMQRLGLVATGEEAHYIPCMNHKIFDEETQNVIHESKVKTSILIFQFEFLPYFFFFRLVVACMQNKDWKVLKSQKSCLYRNAALFSSGDHHIAIAATATSIQLQVYQPKPEWSLEVHKTIEIQSVTEKILENITATFHRRIEFVRGYSCKYETDQLITMEVDDSHFIREQDIVKGDNELCPIHQTKDRHFVNMNKLTKYWKKI
ncbi:uncharacterized protein LOC133204228 [Saccostrea echinata]|uniref:uncharacterized protein LOC133204228 n=1 Tax=Saccostrea echinata TaxID=191078 RepID=UPI002A80FE9E|nr:uncharacterized protein LOC133204228 [Saccostrea echinata]